MSRRYIDADKLLNPDNIIVMQDETGIDEFPYTYTNAVKVETILNSPTADVIEVVRCKDCVYCRPNNDGKLYCHKKADIFVPIVGTDDYCSYGERREV